MSEESETDLSLDLQFLPEWAQEDSGKNKYASHSGDDRKSGAHKGQRRGRNNHRQDDRKGRSGGRPKGKGGRDGNNDSERRKSDSQKLRGRR
ncbi:uncharacterized protein METZ01_LOCUS491267, partial [marine metagenome]